MEADKITKCGMRPALLQRPQSGARSPHLAEPSAKKSERWSILSKWSILGRDEGHWYIETQKTRSSTTQMQTLNTLTLHTPSQYQRLMRVVKGDSGKKARRLSTSISAEIPMSVLNIISKNPPIVAYGRRWWSRHSRKQGSRQAPTEHIRYNTNEAIMPICSLLFDVWYKYELWHQMFEPDFLFPAFPARLSSLPEATSLRYFNPPGFSRMILSTVWRCSSTHFSSFF